jgi:hypothetical protein
MIAAVVMLVYIADPKIQHQERAESLLGGDG